MANRINTFIEKISRRRALRRWGRLANAAKDMDLETLRITRGRARTMMRPLEQVIHVADSRLMLPQIGTDAIQQPLNSDWAYRPEIWRGPITPRGMAAAQNKANLGKEAIVFHDCKISELTLRQIRNTREEDLAPFGLQMDVFKFDGSFLSIVLDLPDDAVHGLKKKHLLRMDAIVEMEKPLEIFARMNVKHGPNTEQIVRELPLHEGDVMVEFDLAYTKLNEKRAERIWIDLIFEGPQMNQIILRDITFSRRPRAEL
ncbi:MAG: hypothetical protein COB39_01715 [Marinosulfonomonas sp.]|nr:MAG: hypothetical protein COB39_01715 [Marinosulfonomonas sp.]